MDVSDLPNFDNIVADAIASGYKVVAYIIDEEDGSSHRIDSFDLDQQKWKAALENLHGGPMTEIEQMVREEIKHRVRRDDLIYSEMTNEEINQWIKHYDEELEALEPDDPYVDVYEEQIEAAKEVIISRHDTWYNPGDEMPDPEGACYCGWIGSEQPLPEFQPPGCKCVTNVEENHGFDIGYITFTEKKMEDER